MRVRLVSLPEERNRSLRILAEVLEIADSNEVIQSCQGKMLLYVEKSETPLRHGDELLLLATPDLPSADDNPHQFNYRQYLKNKGILYTDYIPSSSFRVIGHNGSDFMTIVSDIRLRFINVIRNSRLTPSQQGIAEALLLGWDNDLDSETESHFRDAGITHLLCVSGLHVGIIALLAGHLLFFLSNRRRSRLFKGLFQLTIIWVFVILTGLSPGTMRAGLMFSLVVLGQMLFSRPPTLNTIAASALILLVVNPLLLFDVGFQLSYCSVFAIVTLTPHLEELIPLPSSEGKLPSLVLWLLRKLRALFCVSLAAQLAITPLTLFYFHQFPLYFLLANMVVVPLWWLSTGGLGCLRSSPSFCRPCLLPPNGLQQV